jgi:DNA repair exonuclease SbcCD ATPase subunit
MIIFKSVKWKNFLSTGNAWTEVQLDRSVSTLIIGDNGAGKSTILDALTFGLFGIPFRKIKKPQLVNSVNGRDALVEVEFEIGKRKYCVRRGIKPNVLDIMVDGKSLDQKASIKDQQITLEKNILGLNYKSFTQVVILGSATFTPFMQLPSASRKEVIENLLDIEVFSVMNNILKEKVKKLKEDTKECDFQLVKSEEKIDILKDFIKTLEDGNDAKLAENAKAIADSKKKIAVHTGAIQRLQEKRSKLQSEIEDLEMFTARKQKLHTIRDRLGRTVEKNEKEIAFYNENDNCPTCQQGIEDSFKSRAIGVASDKIAEVNKAMGELETEITTVADRLGEIAETQSEITQTQEQISIEQTSISGLQSYIEKLEGENSVNDTSKIAEEKDKLEKLETGVVTLGKAKDKLASDKYIYDIASGLLKDTGIKTRIIRQYLPIINKLVNKHLSAMDFFVQFELDEAFNETIKSRYRDDFSYASFSEGEKMRIDLALLFTWRQVAKMKNSVNTNLLILDEVFDSSLDTGGTDEFLKIINTLTNDTNVFIISHKGDQLYDKFHSVIRFEKVKNYSRIAQ